MNTAQKIESDINPHPQFRRHNDRVAAINGAMQRVEREHASRLRRMTMLLAGAAALLVVNGLFITLLG
jgi:hypothetical protein